jgi:NAD+ synthase (glutamine-hydrolysing)
VKVALAQINSSVAGLESNVERCLAAIDAARRQDAALVVLPEMAVPGYPPRDILFDPSFVESAVEATADLAYRARGGPPAVVGTIVPSGRHPPEHPGLYNAAVLLSGGEAQMVAAKRLLPAYDVFYEPRWFLPGPASSPTAVAGRRLGVLVCEDLWDEGYDVHPPAELVAAGADLLLCLNASPYRHGILARRLYHARRPLCPLLYVNACGANDELIFDGQSFALDRAGRFLARLPAFEEALQVTDIDTLGSPSACSAPTSFEEVLQVTDIDPLGPPSACSALFQALQQALFQALVLGVRDFFAKNGLDRAFLGLSGGIDSAVVAALAAAALGPARVTAVAIPSRYTDPRSTASARDLAATLGIGFEVVELEPLHAAAEAALGDLVRAGTAAENIQARLRAMILMGLVNRYGGLLLNTSNKTELALGYATLYGDMAGGLCPIADLTKPQVIALARWIDATRSPIPRFILERPPSAELKPGQVDPFDYAEVAPLLEQLVVENRSNQALRRSEHKRWQMGVILKVSDKAFGTGRLIPITRR